VLGEGPVEVFEQKTEATTIEDEEKVEDKVEE